MKHSGNDFAEKMAATPGYNAVRNAQALVAISAKDGNDPMGFNMANAACAAENMILAATDMKIGSRFMMGTVMSLTQEPIKSALDIAEGFVPLVIVALGNTDLAYDERTKNNTNIAYKQ